MGKPSQKQKGITFGYCDEGSGQRVYPAPMTDLLPDQVPPAQSDFHKGEQDGMFATITCTPTLGQATVIAREKGSVCSI